MKSWRRAARRWVCVLVTCVLSVSSARVVEATEAEHEAEVDDGFGFPPFVYDVGLALRFTGRQNEPRTALVVDPDSGEWMTGQLYQPGAGMFYPSSVLSLGAEVEPVPRLLLRTLVDTGELRQGASLEPPTEALITSSGWPISDFLLSGAFVRELYGQYLFGPGSVALGRRHTRVGNGLVYEDFGTGATLDLNFTLSDPHALRLGAAALVVGHSLGELLQPSPLVVLRAAYAWSWFESIGLFGALFVDRAGVIDDVLRSALAEDAIAGDDPALVQTEIDALYTAEFPGSGLLGYLGVEAQALPLHGLLIRGAATGALGSIPIVGPSGEQQLRLSSWAADLRASYGLWGNFGVGALLFALSGDQPPGLRSAQPGETLDYHAFIGVAPYWTWTGLFFSGGLNQGLYPGRAAAGGVNGHGVAGAGLSGEYAGDLFLVELRGAALQALAPMNDAALGGGGSFYGLELDAIVEWNITSWVGLAVEADLFWPGSFFPTSTPAYRAFGQLNVHLGS